MNSCKILSKYWPWRISSLMIPQSFLNQDVLSICIQFWNYLVVTFIVPWSFENPSVRGEEISDSSMINLVFLSLTFSRETNFSVGNILGSHPQGFSNCSESSVYLVIKSFIFKPLRQFSSICCLFDCFQLNWSFEKEL